MDVLILRSQIASVLSADLGTYTLANGETTPAISVCDDGYRTSAGTTVTGLEAVLISQPRLVPVREYQAQNAIREWTVYLLGWGSGVDLQEPAALLVAAFPGTDVRPVAVNGYQGAQNQMRLTIRTNSEPMAYIGNPVTVNTEPDRPQSFTIPTPQAGDALTLFYTDDALTWTQVLATVQGSTPSVEFELRYDADRSAVGTLAATAVVTNTTTGQSVTPTNMPIPANRWVWVEIIAVSGTVDEFSCSLET